MKLLVQGCTITEITNTSEVSSTSQDIEFMFSDEWTNLDKCIEFSKQNYISCIYLRDNTKYLIPADLISEQSTNLSVRVIGSVGSSTLFSTEKIDVGLLTLESKVYQDIGYYYAKSKLRDYLFEIEYNDIDYEYADSYANEYERETTITSMCSAIVNGNYFGRNLDWKYSETPDFIVHVGRGDQRYSSIGLANFSKITNEIASSSEYSDAYRLLPSYMYDGMNEFGLTACSNVVPTDKGSNVAIPEETAKHNLFCGNVVRFILDRFRSASECVDYLRKYVYIYFGKSLHTQKYELHYLISDIKNTYCIEIVNNKYIIIDMSSKSSSDFANRPYITNFYLYGSEPNSDGSYYTPESQDDTHNAIITNKVTSNAAGLERYNYILSNYTSTSSKDGMMNVLDGLKYTKTYVTSAVPSSPFWYSEYVGENNLTCISKVADFADTVTSWGTKFTNRTRTDEDPTWQTVHSCVYDMNNLKLYLRVQEDDFEYSYLLNPDTDGSVCIVSSSDKNIGNCVHVPELTSSDLMKIVTLFEKYSRCSVKTWCRFETLSVCSVFKYGHGIEVSFLYSDKGVVKYTLRPSMTVDVHFRSF